MATLFDALFIAIPIIIAVLINRISTKRIEYILGSDISKLLCRKDLKSKHNRHSLHSIKSYVEALNFDCSYPSNSLSSNLT